MPRPILKTVKAIKPRPQLPSAAECLGCPILTFEDSCFVCDSSGERVYRLPLCPCLRIFSFHSDFGFIASVPLSQDIPYLYNAYKPIPLNITLQQRKRTLHSESRNKWAHYSFFEDLLKSCMKSGRSHHSVSERDSLSRSLEMFPRLLKT